MKFDYFETEWKDRQDWIRNAEKEVQNLWKNEYKRTSEAHHIHELPIRNSQFQSSSPPSLSLGISSPDPPARSHLAVPEFIDVPSWKKNKRARIAADKLDVYDRFIQKEVEDKLPAGPLHYWLERRNDRHLAGLARMGIEIFSIRAMSADPERLFSRYDWCFTK